MDLILICGLSGSGKSVALHLLEDSGYYCVDNLPVVMLTVLVRMLNEEGIRKVAIGIDARSGDGISLLEDKLKTLGDECDRFAFLFLYAKEDTLLKRYSESRQRHPLASEGRTLEEAIRLERELLDPVGSLGHRIDTSDLKANALRDWVRQFIDAEPGRGLILLFESFGFKHGIPGDADFVFDARWLPNPYWEPLLRPLTGRDPEVIRFIEAEPAVARLVDDIAAFVTARIPEHTSANRRYLTVAVGCTGGQHRSVYVVNRLAEHFTAQHPLVSVRHNELHSRHGG